MSIANLILRWIKKITSQENSKQIKRRFYQDWSFVAGAGYSDMGGGSGFKTNYSFKAAPEYFRTYTDYQLDFYGLARRGSEWKGVRMVRN